jgi:hypothetical protein
LWPSLGAQLDDKIEAVHREAKAKQGLNGACMGPADSSQAVGLNSKEDKSGI